MDIESEYAERKGTYDKVAVGLELEKQVPPLPSPFNILPSLQYFLSLQCTLFPANVFFLSLLTSRAFERCE